MSSTVQTWPSVSLWLRFYYACNSSSQKGGNAGCFCRIQPHHSSEFQVKIEISSYLYLMSSLIPHFCDSHQLTDVPPKMISHLGTTSNDDSSFWNSNYAPALANKNTLLQREDYFLQGIKALKVVIFVKLSVQRAVYSMQWTLLAVCWTWVAIPPPPDTGTASSVIGLEWTSPGVKFCASKWQLIDVPFTWDFKLRPTLTNAWKDPTAGHGVPKRTSINLSN